MKKVLAVVALALAACGSSDVRGEETDAAERWGEAHGFTDAEVTGYTVTFETDLFPDQEDELDDMCWDARDYVDAADLQYYVILDANGDEYCSTDLDEQ